MNSVHDIGGTDGFGAVRPEPNEPVFHEPWEGRVLGMLISGTGLKSLPFDALRHVAERLEPVQYLALRYYERMLAALEKVMLEVGTLSSAEIEARTKEFSTNPALAIPRREDPALAGSIPGVLRAGMPVTRTTRQKPRFAVGDRVVTRNMNPHGHTRFPRYTRNRRGIIAAHHGAHVFPDTNAHGLGENPQHLYTVRISARELWGDTAEPNECVLIDLWESYLDSDGKRAKAPAARRPTKAKEAKSKSSSRSPKSARTKTKSIRKKGR